MGPLVAAPTLEPRPPEVVGPTLDMIKVKGGGEPRIGTKGELDESESESKWRLARGLTQTLCGGVSFPNGN